MSKKLNTEIPIGLAGLTVWLTIAFIILKLIGDITWSWFLVLSPLWIGFLLAVFITLVVLVVTL